ncbi:Protein mraZ [Thermodesulfobacterium geofontis OPF15]|uniref:Transcriptional regulator MraZ n=1 Tax=Thermodesulfobacterium geofontis (strain OPF15) TaxID=795359 RepID=F8C5P6_THEGP|nr:division/cell wall cluster transcriptional repressor MraZ [Thermodesulfobacterium geofontis]AEH23032.1 Protein mraZ [Thermodesulfobacterium geofontis OPF15]
MFRGKFKHTLDEKGRFSLPAKFREVLRVKYGSENLVVTNYPDCLVAYPLEEWQKIENKLLSLPWDIPEVRQYVRYFLGAAEEYQPDKQGRILLSQSLREEIKLEREVILLGMLTHFEIWNPKYLESKFKETKENFSKVMQIINPYLTGVKNLSP